MQEIERNEKSMISYKIGKEVMIKESKALHFSCETQVSEKAVLAEKKLIRLRE
jgi:hypothetical protein